MATKKSSAKKPAGKAKPGSKPARKTPSKPAKAKARSGATAKKTAGKTPKKVAKKPVKKAAGKPSKKAAVKAPPSRPAKQAAKAKTKKKYGLSDKVMRPKEVAWRMIEGEAVIVTPTDSMMHSLNEVGTRIWELMDGTRTVRDIATALQAEFEVDKVRAEKDTVWFVECLAKKGLVVSP